MDNILDKAFGAGYSEANEKLDSELLKIQEKYSTWFDENLKEDEYGEKHNILYYKFVYYNPPMVSFNITIDNLPDHIRHECHEKFKESFGI
ncbi:hypothetical protein [Sphingobacterium multivorum]|uniref:hypothetical protein n=1 Tax=Sphingobacterium multivorum TaxID=28454 RepID=UPI00369D68E3